jgi:hypothetical protein
MSIWAWLLIGYLAMFLLSWPLFLISKKRTPLRHEAQPDGPVADSCDGYKVQDEMEEK